jgi:predicted enzyme related to lactoylglutathione lyase
MLRVPSVDKTVSYWTEKGGKVLASRERGVNGNAQLMSAFVALGRTEQSKDGDDNSDKSECFAFEFVVTDKETYNLGNIISYVGVSMLLQFQNNLLGLVQGEKPQQSQGDEPNGIDVKLAASAPGDLLARFALKSKNLAATQTFYESILGFDAKGADENMLCLRYNTASFPGVPTMLIFDATDEDLVMGDCFDHLAIFTTTSIDVQHQRIKESGSKIFMNPTEMFGKKVMGVIDPNGYKVVLASD